MTAEHEATRVALAKLQIKLDRVKLAADRMEQIWRRANRRKFQDVHSQESRALAENVRIIVHELHPEANPVDVPGE
jgi:hypothetical protein